MTIKQPAGCPHCEATAPFQLRGFRDSVKRPVVGIDLNDPDVRVAHLTWHCTSCGGQFSQTAAIAS